jgi:hypothetical protein
LFVPLAALGRYVAARADQTAASADTVGAASVPVG